MESKQEIARLLNTITQQYKSIYLNHHKIPPIELDIVKQNIRHLYDKLRDFEMENNELDEEAPGMQFTNGQVNKQQQKEVTTAIEFGGEPIEKKPVEKQNKETTRKTHPHPENKKQTDSYQKGEKKQEEKSGNSSLADKYVDEKNSINDKISPSNEQTTVASKLEKNPVYDIKSAIGINEKYLFIRELFDGNTKTYQEVLDRFTTLLDWKQALNYLNDLADTHDWSDEDQNYQRFYQIISRKFNY